MIFKDAAGRVVAQALAVIIAVLPASAHAQPDSGEPLARPDLRMLVPVMACDLARHAGPLALDGLVVLPPASVVALARLPHRVIFDLLGGPADDADPLDPLETPLISAAETPGQK